MTRLLIAFLLCAATAAHAADMFTFSNPPGPHYVGVKIVQQYDRTRLYKSGFDLATGEPNKGERARPMQLVVWYPAQYGGAPVTYHRYLETMATEDEFTRSAAEVKRMTDERIQGDAGSRHDVVQREIARPMRAVLDAHPENGKFPVVIYAPSYSASAVENADLCEYLASQGYVVLSSPSLGAHTRSITIDLDGLETQAADIRYLIGYASTLPQADVTEVAAVGYSWGGLANVFAAAQDGRIKALVSLDGSLRGYSQFVDGGNEAEKYVTPTRVSIPLLYVGSRPRTVEQLNRAQTSTRYSFLNEMKYSDVYIVSMFPMTHASFSSYAIRTSQDDEFGDYTRDEVALAHSWAARYVRYFLDAYLKNDASGLAFVNNAPTANNAPPHMMIVDIHRKKESLPPTREAFAQRLATDGFDKATVVYEQFVAQSPTFKLDANEIFGWGVELDSLHRSVQAREILRLGTHLYPNMSSMVAGLAETQVETGQTEEAVKSYRRVLELDPTNVDAIKFLNEHKTQPNVSTR